jgi:hypothetical protein
MLSQLGFLQKTLLEIVPVPVPGEIQVGSACI